MTFVFPYRQWFSFSCSAATFSTLVRHLTGLRVPHSDAIQITGCRPDGCTMARLRRVLRKYGIASKVIQPGIRNFRQELDRGRLLVVDDNRTYINSHVMVVHGHTRHRFWIIDPVIGLPTMRNCRRVARSCQEAFAVWRAKGRSADRRLPAARK